jgi:hypothetical protein
MNFPRNSSDSFKSKTFMVLGILTAAALFWAMEAKINNSWPFAELRQWWHMRKISQLERRFRLEHQSYVTSVELPLGAAMRPTPDTAFTLELIEIDPKLQQGEFKVVFGTESFGDSGLVHVSNQFAFSTRLDRLGLWLQQLTSTSAIVGIPGAALK